ncbi:MAG: membrane protein insertion efficiency factor YidD [Clostridia bacterium]|nr:membrane protein insertion efficiency factor YidD [Clostridia bacterium]
MKNLKKIINFPFKIFGISLIYCYKFLISPLIPHTCRFTPTCSTYALEAIKEFGFFKGCCLAFKRISRCVPNGKTGFDPIPFNIKGDIKWLI